MSARRIRPTVPLPPISEMASALWPPKSRREAFDQIDELRVRLAVLLDMPLPAPIQRSTRWPPFLWLTQTVWEHQAALRIFQRLMAERPPAPSTDAPTSES